MKLPLVDLKAQYATIQGEIDAALQRVLRSTAFILGPEVAAFEKDFADFCESRFAIGVSSGTDALHLALRACGIGEGHEVITTPFTFIATAEAICMAGARPVFVDIDNDTLNLDVRRIEVAITPRTRAIMPVHLFGNPADMVPLNELAKAHNLRVIEDAAQAHGARSRGRVAGTLGGIACFSFYPGKNLGAYGDGGAVVTNDEGIAERVRMLRDHGRRDKYEHLMLGYGNRLDALQAAILGVKLRHLSEWNARRAAIALRYNEAFAGTEVLTQRVPEWNDSVWHMYAIRVTNRDAVRDRLGNAGISTGVHYPIPLHLQPAFASFGLKRGDFPLAERAAAAILSLPMYPEMSDEAVQYVIDAVMAALLNAPVQAEV